MFKIFGNGQGGKHRANDPSAQTHRLITREAAKALRATYPDMQDVIVQCYAETVAQMAMRGTEIRAVDIVDMVASVAA